MKFSSPFHDSMLGLSQDLLGKKVWACCGTKILHRQIDRNYKNITQNYIEVHKNRSAFDFLLRDFHLQRIYIA